MTLGNTPPSPRWLSLVAGALAASLAACDSNTPSTPDAAADAPPADMAPPPDAGDAPQPPPDMTVPPDMMPPPPDMMPPPPDMMPPPPDMMPPPVDVPDAPDAPSMPTVTTRAIVNCGMACSRPLDAIPDARGANVYFTAYAPDGRPGVFRAAIPAAGMPPATPTAIVTGMGLEFPLGIAISNDDATLYIADQTADRGMRPGVGAVFSLPVAGGAPTVLNVGDALIQPVSITVSFDGNELFIGGQQEVTDAMMEVTRQRAVFRVSRGGGTATVVTTNVVDPSGLSQASTGVVLCHDTRRGGGRSATAVTIGPAGINNYAGGLVANYPAGLGFSVDGRFALFSGADPTVGPGMLTLAGGEMANASMELSAGMVSPQGLHRARMVDAWAVADERAGDSGQIFLVSRTP